MLPVEEERDVAVKLSKGAQCSYHPEVTGMQADPSYLYVTRPQFSMAPAGSQKVMR